MCLRNTAIEDRLQGAGYKTERIGDVVNAHDPVHASLPGHKERVVTHWKLVEVRTTDDAWDFIQARS